jgi:hypothetical protein
MLGTTPLVDKVILGWPMLNPEGLDIILMASTTFL